MRVAVVGTPRGALAAALPLADVEVVDAAAPADLALAVDWTAARRLADADAPALALLREDLAERTLDPDDPRRAAARAVDAIEMPSVVTAAWLADLPLGETVLVRLGADPPAVDAPPPAEPDGTGATADAAPASNEPEGAAPAAAPSADAAPGGTSTPPLRVRVHGPQALVAQIVAEAREPLAVVATPGAADVVLDLTRRERRPGPTSEAMRHGAAAVATLPPGREELVEHGRNGLVVAWDDPRGTARTLDLLASDRALLARLRAGALETARALPSHADAARELTAALRRLAAVPASDELRASLRALPDPAAAQATAAAETPAGWVAPLRRLRRRPRVRRALDALGRATR